LQDIIHVTATILFEGRDILVRANLYGKRDNLVITFSPLIPFRYIPGPGFAEEPLSKLHITNIVFINKWNHWWQTPEMIAGIEQVRRAVAELSPSRISAYGSSMGGYGALIFSGLLQCTHVLALGPQYSIDRKKVPFEQRWPKAAETLSFQWDDMDDSLRSPAEKFVLYDNKGPDRCHIELMKGRTLHKLAIPYGSHAVGRFFRDTEQLKSLLSALVRGELESELPLLIREARANRRSSPAYMLALLDKLEATPHHRKSALRMAELFVRNKPRQFKLRIKLARLLLQEGRPGMARKHAERAVALNRTSLSSLTLLRDVHEARGDTTSMSQVEERIACLDSERCSNDEPGGTTM
jgi:hypothetical protein